jgi:DNA-binding transcriptional LysR family regulator
MKDELILIASPRTPSRSARGSSERSRQRSVHRAYGVVPVASRVVDAFRASGTPLNIVMEVAMIETIKKLIAMNLGIGFIPEMCVQDEIERRELVRVPVEGFQYQETLWLARRRTDARAAAADAFASLAIGAAPMRRTSKFISEPEKPVR